jgi:hypothetical protein
VEEAKGMDTRVEQRRCRHRACLITPLYNPYLLNSLMVVWDLAESNQIITMTRAHRALSIRGTGVTNQSTILQIMVVQSIITLILWASELGQPLLETDNIRL